MAPSRAQPICVNGSEVPADILAQIVLEAGALDDPMGMGLVLDAWLEATLAKDMPADGIGASDLIAGE